MKYAVAFLSSTLFIMTAAQAGQLFYGSQRTERDFRKNCAYSISLPRLKIEDGTRAQEALVTELNDTFSQLARTFIEEYKTDTEEESLCTKDAPGHRRTTIPFLATGLDEPVASVYFDEYTTVGGTQPGHARQSFSFNPRTGARYNDLTAFFAPRSINAFKARLREGLTAQELSAADGFSDWEESHRTFADVTQFYFTPKGLTVFFDRGAVGPTSADIVEVLLEWDAIRELGLKSDSPLAGNWRVKR